MDDLLAIGMEVRLLSDIDLDQNECDIERVIAGAVGHINSEMQLSTGMHYSVDFGDIVVIGIRSDELEME